MRRGMMIFGWLSVAGSVFDGLIALIVLWLAARGEANPGITVDTHLREHLAFIYWVKDVAFVVMPDGVVRWLFGLPALIYFPVRVAMSIVIGGGRWM